jgi:hypothetical protein
MSDYYNPTEIFNQVQQNTQAAQQRRTQYSGATGVELPWDKYDQLQSLKDSGYADDEMIYRISASKMLSDFLGTDPDFTYDYFEELWNGYTDNEGVAHEGASKARENIYAMPLSRLQSIKNSIDIAKNNLPMAKLGLEMMTLDRTGSNPERRQEAFKEFQQRNQDNERLSKGIPQDPLTFVITSTIQSAPSTGMGIGAGLLGGALGAAGAGAVGALAGGAGAAPGTLGGFYTGYNIASSVASSAEMIGLMYGNLINSGVKPENALGLAMAGGTLQGIIETSLGNIKALGKSAAQTLGGKVLSKEAIDRISQNTTKKFVKNIMSSGLAGKISKNLAVRTGTGLLRQAGEETIEEGLQALVDQGVLVASQAMQDESVEVPDSKQFFDTLTNNMMGGFAGGLGFGLLGLPLSIKGNMASAKVYSDNVSLLKGLASVIQDKNVFTKEQGIKNNPVLSGIKEDAQKEDVLGEIWESQAGERERFKIDAASMEEERKRQALPGMPTIQKPGEYRGDESGAAVISIDQPEQLDGTANGRVYLRDAPTNSEMGSAVIRVNAQDKTLDISDVEISDAITNKPETAANMIKELLYSYPDYEINWNPESEEMQAVKNYLVNSNPKGAEQELNYYTASEVNPNVSSGVNEQRNNLINKTAKIFKDTSTNFEATKSVFDVFERMFNTSGINFDDFMDYSVNIQSSAENTIPIVGNYIEVGQNRASYLNMTENPETPYSFRAQTLWLNNEGQIVPMQEAGEEVLDGAKAIITAGEKANLTDLIHEMAHVFVTGVIPNAPALRQILENAMGKSIEDFDEQDHERIANELNNYIANGELPKDAQGNEDRGLRAVFDRIIQAISSFINGDRRVSPGLKRAFDTMLSGNPELARQLAANSSTFSTMTAQERTNMNLEGTPEVLQDTSRAIDEDPNNQPMNEEQRIIIGMTEEERAKSSPLYTFEEKNNVPVSDDIKVLYSIARDAVYQEANLFEEADSWQGWDETQGDASLMEWYAEEEPGKPLTMTAEEKKAWYERVHNEAQVWAQQQYKNDTAAELDQEAIAGTIDETLPDWVTEETSSGEISQEELNVDLEPLPEETAAQAEPAPAAMPLNGDITENTYTTEQIDNQYTKELNASIDGYISLIGNILTREQNPQSAQEERAIQIANSVADAAPPLLRATAEGMARRNQNRITSQQTRKTLISYMTRPGAITLYRMAYTELTGDRTLSDMQNREVTTGESEVISQARQTYRETANLGTNLYRLARNADAIIDEKIKKQIKEGGHASITETENALRISYENVAELKKQIKEINDKVKDLQEKLKEANDESTFRFNQMKKAIDLSNTSIKENQTLDEKAQALKNRLDKARESYKKQIAELKDKYKEKMAQYKKRVKDRQALQEYLAAQKDEAKKVFSPTRLSTDIFVDQREIIAAIQQAIFQTSKEAGQWRALVRQLEMANDQADQIRTALLHETDPQQKATLEFELQSTESFINSLKATAANIKKEFPDISKLQTGIVDMESPIQGNTKDEGYILWKGQTMSIADFIADWEDGKVRLGPMDARFRQMFKRSGRQQAQYRGQVRTKEQAQRILVASMTLEELQEVNHILDTIEQEGRANWARVQWEAEYQQNKMREAINLSLDNVLSEGELRTVKQYIKAMATEDLDERKEILKRNGWGDRAFQSLWQWWDDKRLFQYLDGNTKGIIYGFLISEYNRNANIRDRATYERKDAIMEKAVGQQKTKRELVRKYVDYIKEMSKPEFEVTDPRLELAPRNLSVSMDTLMGEIEKGADPLGLYNNDNYWTKSQNVKLSKAQVLYYMDVLDNDSSRDHIVFGIYWSPDQRAFFDNVIKYYEETGNQAGIVRIYKEMGIIGNDKETILRTTVEQANINQHDIDIAKAIQGDFNAHFEELRTAMAYLYNQYVEPEQNYLPAYIVTGVFSQDTREKTWEALTYGQHQFRISPDKGMTHSRIYIPPHLQMGVNDNIFEVYERGVEKEEHFIKMAPYIKELNGIFRGRNNESTRLQTRLNEMFGKWATERLMTHINLQGYSPSARTSQVVDGAAQTVRLLSGNVAAATIGLNIPSWLAQYPQSIAIAFAYSNPGILLHTLFEMPVNGNKIVEQVWELSPKVRDRVQNLASESLRILQYQQEQGALSKVQEKMVELTMKGQEHADRTMVSAQWWSLYQTALQEKGMDKQSAITWADDIISETQPDLNDIELSPGYRGNNQLGKILLRFSQPLNVVWQNLTYDLIISKDKGMRKIIGTIVPMALANFFVALIRGQMQPPEDKTDESMARYVAGVFLDLTVGNFTEAVPLVSEEVEYAFDKLIKGNGIQYENRNFPVVSYAFVDLPRNLSNGKWGAAIWAALSAVGYIFGAPVTLARRIKRAIEQKQPGIIAGFEPNK